MKIHKVIIFVLFAGIFLAACAPSSSGQISPTVDSPEKPASTQAATPGQAGKTAVDAAMAALTRALNIKAEQVKINAVEAVDWPNACLGMQKPGEMCSEIVTPGYRVVLEASGKTYEYHTNQDGSVVRALDEVLPSSSPSASLSPVENAALQALSQQIGVAPDKIKVVLSEPVEWPNGCLGIDAPGRMCTQVITPGYRVVLEAGGKQYEFHTNEAGTTVLLAGTVPSSAPQPKTPDKVLVWEQTEQNICSHIEISMGNVIYGPCGGAMKNTPLAGGRLMELELLGNKYKPFNVDTPAGTVEFNGMGQQEPAPSEMRSVAEWARLVFMEVQGGRGGAAWGLAFSWHREGGIAGFCDDLGVYRTGWAVPSSCKNGQGRVMPQYRLTPAELEKMYQWLDQLASFDYEQKDTATADAMLVKLSFMGTGAEQASAGQKEEIAAFAGMIYANAVNK